MTDNNKTLVSAGHELASELKADCGAVDVRSVANLLTELASALDVQSARSDALSAELKQSKIDAGCYKHGMEQSNKRLTEIADENAVLKSNADKARQVIMSSKFDYWSDRCELLEAVRLIDETPATDAWVNEQRDAILAATFEAAKQEVERRFGRTFQDCAWLARRSSDTQMKGAVEMAEWVELYAAQLRGSQV